MSALDRTSSDAILRISFALYVEYWYEIINKKAAAAAIKIKRITLDLRNLCNSDT
jgi:hypothetical protein